MIKSSIIDFSQDWERQKEESQGLEKDFVFTKDGFFKTETTNKDLHKLPDSGLRGKLILKFLKRDDTNVFVEVSPWFIDESFFKKYVNTNEALKERFLKDFEKNKMCVFRVNIATKIINIETIRETKCK